MAIHILYHYDHNVLLSPMVKIIFLYNTSFGYFLLFHYHGIIPKPEYYAPLNPLFLYILQSLTIMLSSVAIYSLSTRKCVLCVPCTANNYRPILPNIWKFPTTCTMPVIRLYGLTGRRSHRPLKMCSMCTLTVHNYRQ